MTLGGKAVLKDVSFDARAGTRTAVIGPTAAGKTQLLYLLTGLLKPTSGTVEFDGRPIDDYDKTALHQQIGFVFQDSIIFNLTLRENIAFSKTVTDEDLEKADRDRRAEGFHRRAAGQARHRRLRARHQPVRRTEAAHHAGAGAGAESESAAARRLHRARRFDDRAARSWRTCSGTIPGITLLSVTQKIASVEDYDQIVLLMEGEVLASGTHRQLMETSPEYVQIYDSQRSTSHYELLRAQ